MDTREENTLIDPSSACRMDWSLETAEERVKKVEEIIANTPSEKLTPVYLERLATYILDPIQKKEKKTKDRTLLTDNKIPTINKRETSFEGLADKLENGEDGIYSMITNDKNILFAPKAPITEEDIATIPGLRELREEIAKVEERQKTAKGRLASLLHKQLIEMRKDQYVLKEAYNKTAYAVNVIRSLPKLDLSGFVGVDAEDEVFSTELVNLFTPKHISALLCNYSRIKEDCWDKFDSDIKWLMEDLDDLIVNTLQTDYPLYYDLLVYKIDGMTNAEIQEQLYFDYEIKHSVEYISSLWRNKIPGLLADAAIDDWLVWHYTMEDYGNWKKCHVCGQIKLAHKHFFSKNSTSKDGWYSICKKCRNKRG